jgi:DNA sulfur modification protein DndC
MKLLEPFESFEALDEAYRQSRRFILAYSGGKDSTATAILLYKWVLERRPRDLEVVVLHNDTLSEVPTMEHWARRFMGEYVEKMMKLSVRVVTEVATPEPTDTFYWRVFVRGYPAPTFSFRWCVELLKISPTKRALGRYRDYILIVGSRDEESTARSRSMRARFGSCMAQGSCIGAYFATDNDIPKVAPIRFWSTEDVWAFLKTQRYFDVKPLFGLYLLNGNLNTRYGCWHCTLARIQQGLYVSDEYLHAEALRFIYRAVSDTPSLRVRKESGYSRLGPLNAVGRSIIYRAIPIIEERIGEKFFYGLDETRVENHTLRELFYEMPEDKADATIRRVDSTNRPVPMSALRGGKIDRDIAKEVMGRVRNIISNNNPFKGKLLNIAKGLVEEICNC